MDDEEDESVGRRWNGAAAQAAAMIISGMDGGSLNGPTNGGYRPPPANYNAPIVRPAWDEMDDEEDESVGQNDPTRHKFYSVWKMKFGKNLDEMDDEEVGDQFSGQPSHTRAHQPNGQSVSNYFGSWDEMDDEEDESVGCRQCCSWQGCRCCSLQRL
jgi:hypothetical protein